MQRFEESEESDKYDAASRRTSTISRASTYAPEVDGIISFDDFDKRITQSFSRFDDLPISDGDLHVVHTTNVKEKAKTSGGQSRDAEKATPTPPTAVGFWHKDLGPTRKEVLKKYTKTVSMLCVAVFAVLSIYWGVLFTVKDSLSNVSVAVVNFDGLPPYDNIVPIVGPAVVAVTKAEVASRPDHLGFVSRPPSDYDNDPLKVRKAVHNQDVWAAIIINANATTLLLEAIETGNTSYDPFGAAQIVYNQARDIESYNQYIIPVLDRLAYEITASFGRNFTSRVLSNNTFDSSIYSQVPQALSPSIGFSIYNLRPFDPPTAIPTISIGLIYLIIIAFFSFTFFIPTHMKFILPNPTSPHPPLKFHQLIIYRYLATLTTYLFLSLSYSLVSLAFQIPFSNIPPAGSSWPTDQVVNNATHFRHATFVVYWLLNFLGMCALGLACENMAMLLTLLGPTPYAALWLIFWVITNVSTGFYALELAPRFYVWGYVWPLRQIVEASKTLVFGTKDRLAVNFGVLLVWVALGSVLFPFACWVMRWTNMRTKKRELIEATKKTVTKMAC